MAGVFLSYARNDDEAFVRTLYERLRAEQLDTWFDREQMPSRSLTFLQEIRDAIRARDRVVVALGPAAVASAYVRAEWQAALVDGKVVTPVLRLGDYDLVPAELANLHCPDMRSARPFETSFAELLRVLREPVPPLGALLGAVPDVPAHFQPRPDAITALAGSLLYDIEHPAVLDGPARVTVLHGMGGVGKSVMGAAFARSISTRRVFGDGVVWVALTPTTSALEALREALGVAGRPLAPTATEVDAVTALREWLATRRCLLVLDNAWHLDQVVPFAQALSEVSRLLLTTRDAGIATSLGSQAVGLDVLDDEEARRHLADWVGLAVEDLPEAARGVADECGGLPFAIAVQGALAHDGVAWSDLLLALRDAQLDYAEQQFPGYPYRHVLAALQVSVDVLREADPAAAARLLDLGAFLWDDGVAPGAVTGFWDSARGLPPHLGRKLLVQLERKALLRTQAPAGVVRLHDLMVDYVDTASDRRQLAADLLDAYRGRSPDDWPSGPDDGYFHAHLLDHLAALEDDGGELWRLLRLDGADGGNGWFAACDRTGNVEAYRRQLRRLIDDAPTTVAQALCLTIMLASVGSLAGNLPAPLLGALVAGGVWTPAQALGYARQVPDAGGRVQSILAVLRFLDGDEHGQTLTAASLAAGSVDAGLSGLDALAGALAEAGRTEEALSVARRAASGDERSQALAAVGAHLAGLARGDVVAEAIEAAGATLDLFRSAALEPVLPLLDRAGVMSAWQSVVEPLANPVMRGWCTTPLVERLVELGDVDAARTLAVEMADAPSRAKAMARLAGAVPPPERQQRVEEALAVLLAVDDAQWRSDVADSFDHLPAFLDDMLPVVLDDLGYRAELLAELAPHLSRPQLDRVVELVQTSDDPSFVSAAAAALAPVVHEAERAVLLDDALALALADAEPADRASALIALVPVAADRRQEVAAAALDAVAEVGSAEVAAAMAAVAPGLREADLDRALDVIGSIGEPDSRSGALAPIALSLDRDQLLRARAIASTIGDRDEVLLAVGAIVGCLGAAPDDVLLRRVEEHPDEYVRARAVALLAPVVADAQLPRIEQLVDTIEYPTSLAEVALPVLARRLPEPGRTATLRRALEVAASMDDAERAAWVVDAVCADLDETLAGEALDGVSPSPDDEWRHFRRARVAATVLGRLGPSRRAAVQDEVLELAAAMEDPGLRRDVLGIAGDHLDDGGWERAVALTEAEADPYDRGILAGLLVHAAPAPLRTRLMAAALAEIDTVGESGWMSAAERMEGAWARVLPYTGDPVGALELVAGFEDPGWRRVALEAFARQVPPGSLDRLLVLASGIDAPDDRALGFVALAAAAPAERRAEILDPALRAAVADASDLLHDRVLPPLAEALADLPVEEVQALWRAQRDVLVSLDRPQLLRKLHGLAPVVVRLGPDVGATTVLAILDGARWWP